MIKTFHCSARLRSATLWEDFSSAATVSDLLPRSGSYRDNAHQTSSHAAETGTASLPKPADKARKEALNRFKDQELFRIDAKPSSDRDNLLTSL